jgi:serine/alanine adding enzyme
MFRCVQFTDCMKDEWDRFVLSKGTIFQTIAFRDILLHSFGYKCGYHAILDRYNHICATIPMVIGRNLKLKKAGVSLPFVNYSDICAESEEALHFAMASIREWKDKYRLDYIELRLKEQDLSDSSWRLQLQNCTFVLPLAADEEKVLALATSSCRNHVRKAYKNNYFTVSFDTKHMKDFYSVYVKRMKQLGSPAPDIHFFTRFFEDLPQNTHLLTVLDQQTRAVVGGMLLLVSPGNSTVYYPYGANLVEYNSKYLNSFMYWEAVRFGIKSGMKYLDLGRSQKGSGTFKYKEQWGAKAEQLKYLVYNGGQEESGPPDREKLSIFVALWKIVPRMVTDPIGRQLIKYLMP